MKKILRRIRIALNLYCDPVLNYPITRAWNVAGRWA